VLEPRNSEWLRLETASAREAEDAILLERVAASFQTIPWR